MIRLAWGHDEVKVRFVYIHGADEVFVSHQDIRHGKSKDDRTDPRSHKTLNSLLRRQLDELGTAKGNATDVGEDIVGDDQGCWEEEPDHTLENVVHDEMGLYDNEVEGHVRPGELGELEAVVTFFKGCDKEYKPCRRVSCGFSIQHQ